jgi:hypothetical protein
MARLVHQLHPPPFFDPNQSPHFLLKRSERVVRVDGNKLGFLNLSTRTVKSFEYEMSSKNPKKLIVGRECKEIVMTMTTSADDMPLIILSRFHSLALCLQTPLYEHQYIPNIEYSCWNSQREGKRKRNE